MVATPMVAAIDRDELTFKIEEVNVYLMKKYLYPEMYNDNEVVQRSSGRVLSKIKAMPWKERISYLQENDSAFSLIFPKDGAGLDISYGNFYYNMDRSQLSSFKVKPFAQIFIQYANYVKKLM